LLKREEEEMQLNDMDDFILEKILFHFARNQ